MLVDVIDDGSEPLSCYERACKLCNKVFIVQSFALYVYKLQDTKGRTEYYCCYSHWRQAQSKREVDVIASREKYYETMRANKNKNNKNRRDKQRGLTQNV
jgi:hypothetical protein